MQQVFFCKKGLGPSVKEICVQSMLYACHGCTSDMDVSMLNSAKFGALSSGNVHGLWVSCWYVIVCLAVGGLGTGNSYLAEKSTTMICILNQLTQCSMHTSLTTKHNL